MACSVTWFNVFCKDLLCCEIHQKTVEIEKWSFRGKCEKLKKCRRPWNNEATKGLPEPEPVVVMVLVYFHRQPTIIDVWGNSYSSSQWTWNASSCLILCIYFCPASLHLSALVTQRSLGLAQARVGDLTPSDSFTASDCFKICNLLWSSCQNKNNEWQNHRIKPWTSKSQPVQTNKCPFRLASKFTIYINSGKIRTRPGID